MKMNKYLLIAMNYNIPISFNCTFLSANISTMWHLFKKINLSNYNISTETYFFKKFYINNDTWSTNKTSV